MPMAARHASAPQLASKIAALRRKLLEATVFSEIADDFFDNLGDDPAFIELGEFYADVRFAAVLAEAAAAATGTEVAVYQGSAQRIAEHRFIHGAFTLGRWTGMMFYFEDIEVGFMALGDLQGPSRFVRFSLVASPDGKSVKIH